MRRLSRDEYALAVQASSLPGDSIRQVLPVDEKNGTFSGNTVTPVSRPDLESYLNAAEQLTENLDLAKHFGCDVATEACMSKSIEKVGKRMLRRPLLDSEKADFLALWTARKTTPQEGARVVLQAMLVMPSFIYRPETGQGNAEVRDLTPYEIATRLSFFATGGPPNELLLGRAENGELGTTDGILAAYKELATSSGGYAQVRNFYGQWTGVGALGQTEKDNNIFPKFTADVRQKVQDETLTFFETAHRKNEPVQSLFKSQRAFVSASTAFLYGVSSSAPTTEQVELPNSGRRQGFLTLPGILATSAHAADHASPIFRGKFVRLNLLCLPLTPPPNNVKVELPPLQPGMTTRERYDALMADQYCKGCHTLMNPIGYGFLRFNAIGEEVELDAKKPIDDTGEVIGGGELDGTFAGAKGLSDKLASSSQFQSCYASQWIHFALARPPQNIEQCTIERMALTLAGEGDLGKAAEALVQSDTFRKVRVHP
jgi:Protein of unknown function (DUF1592)/Protein of unknown function (DUF1588)/Protein of unknown function (DUF1585)/Protein of unknown function (DUF1595)/Protein of unknown function (DUF1587)